jgi:hypothetical protein
MRLCADLHVAHLLYQQQRFSLIPGIARDAISKCLRFIESVKAEDWRNGDDSVHSWSELSGPCIIDLDVLADADVLSGIIGAKVRASFQWINVYRSGQYIPGHRDAGGDAHLLSCIRVPSVQEGGQLWLGEESEVIPLGAGDGVYYSKRPASRMVQHTSCLIVPRCA